MRGEGWPADAPPPVKHDLEVYLRAVAASEPGALDGWRYDCPVCGMKIGSSLETIARKEADEHAAWHRNR